MEKDKRRQMPQMRLWRYAPFQGALMTNTVFTDSVDTLGLALVTLGIVIYKPFFIILGAFCFVISFGARLIIDARIEKYLNGIRDKVNK